MYSKFASLWVVILNLWNSILFQFVFIVIRKKGYFAMWKQGDARSACVSTLSHHGHHGLLIYATVENSGAQRIPWSDHVWVLLFACDKWPFSSIETVYFWSLKIKKKKKKKKQTNTLTLFCLQLIFFLCCGYSLEAPQEWCRKWFG